MPIHLDQQKEFAQLGPMEQFAHWLHDELCKSIHSSYGGDPCCGWYEYDISERLRYCTSWQSLAEKIWQKSQDLGL